MKSVIDALVPAWNEETTIGQVVRTLRASPGIGRVVVLSDGSTDATECRAREAGADVYTHAAPNWGKGRLMRAGLELVTSPRVGFFDADLLRFEPRHVAKMLAVAGQGYDQVCGLRDYGVMGAPAVLMPIITGERICKRELVDQVPADCWDRYGIETALNTTARRLGFRTACVILDGVRNRNKVVKVGWARGVVRQAKMAGEILGVRQVLERSYGRSCTCLREG